MENPKFSRDQIPGGCRSDETFYWQSLVYVSVYAGQVKDPTIGEKSGTCCGLMFPLISASLVSNTILSYRAGLHISSHLPTYNVPLSQFLLPQEAGMGLMVHDYGIEEYVFFVTHLQTSYFGVHCTVNAYLVQ